MITIDIPVQDADEDRGLGPPFFLNIWFISCITWAIHEQIIAWNPPLFWNPLFQNLHIRPALLK